MQTALVLGSTRATVKHESFEGQRLVVIQPLTADDAEKLLVRSKEFYDGAVPSGNSMAAYNLLRLARLTGRADLEEKASATARAFGEDATKRPEGHTMLLTALDFAIGPSVEVVISGDPDRWRSLGLTVTDDGGATGVAIANVTVAGNSQPNLDDAWVSPVQVGTNTDVSYDATAKTCTPASSWPLLWPSR